MKKALVLLVLIGLLAYGGVSYVHRDSQTQTVFKTAAVERGDLVVSISATGTVEPEEVIDVGAQIAAQILSFGKDVNGKTVDYGSAVEEGTVLANLDDALYTSEVAQADAQVVYSKGGVQKAEADLEQSKAKLYQAEQNWKRAEQLGMGSTALAATDYDGYKVAYDSAKANVAMAEAAIIQAKGSLAQAESTLERAKRNLGYTTIKSPVKGVIIDRRVNIGQTVVASLNAPSLFLIAKDLTRMQVWVAVNEADIGKLRSGQPVSFTVDAFPGENFTGEVGKIRLNASMTQNVVTYTVEVVTDNSSGRLLPYLTANVKFELQRRKNVLMVPNAALRWTPTVEQVAPQYRNSAETSTSPASQPASGDAQPTIGTVYVQEGAFVRPVFVHVGVTDEVVTAVQGEGLAEGAHVITGEDEEATAAAQSAGGTNPFLPKPPKFGKGGPPPPM
jgi:HlyD family secretion protein